MGIKIGWDDDQKTTIRYEFAGRWDCQTFERAIEQSFTMTESVTHEVHVIMDMTRSKETPDGAFLYFKRKLSVLPHNRGMIVFAGGDATASVMIKMLTRLNSKVNSRLIAADTVAEARQALQKVNMTDVLKSENPVFVVE